jgi:hypothetical protein
LHSGINTAPYYVAGKATDPSYKVEEKTGGLKGLMTFEAGNGLAQVHNGKTGFETEVRSNVIVGVFLKRSTLGEGHVVLPGVTMAWNYKAQGMTEDMDLVVKVFAVEMVLVNSGDFEVGFLGNTTYHPGGFVKSTGTAPFNGGPFKISSEAVAISMGVGAGKLWTITGTAPTLIEGKSIPDTFPKGFRAFYIMKYELTQEAFCEMLNTVSNSVAQSLMSNSTGWYNFTAEANTPNSKNHGSLLANRPTNQTSDDLGAASSYRIIMAWKKSSSGGLEFGCDANNNGVFNETSTFMDTLRGELMTFSIDGQDIPVHWMSPYFLVAYSGFAGLRPMTELEYEKACRGSKSVAADEFAWGNGSYSATAANIMYGDNVSLAVANYNGDDGSRLFSWINTGREKAINPASNIGAGKSAARRIWWATWWGGRVPGGWWAGVGSDWWNWRKHWYSGTLLRVGAFADTTTNRQTSGASYWGVMNLSDNSYELCIQITETGLKYNGEHGNGVLISDVNGVYPDGTNNAWRLPINTNAMWMDRGIRYRTYTGNNNDDNINTYTNYLTVGTMVGSPFDPLNTGRVGNRANSGGGFAYTDSYNKSQKTLNPFTGIRCVRTVGAAK